jgi:hypothetical protein
VVGRRPPHWRSHRPTGRRAPALGTPPPAEPTRTSARHGRSRTALELRGWLDDIPTVVPWIDGRPLWPRNPYEKVNLDDQQERDHFATLMGWGRPQQADDIP